jgi:hypothetical protein
MPLTLVVRPCYAGADAEAEKKVEAVRKSLGF